ncbi:MAG: ABC transporter permease, partial [Alphaproteobacteria bacterium]|nr:ABC transporter permease [Alphaproteobacteria bacterium]
MVDLAAPLPPQGAARAWDAAAEAIMAPSPGLILRRRIFGHGGLMIGAAVLAIIAFVALAAPLLAPHDPYGQDLARRLIPPLWHDKGTWAHPLGTDQLGRDYLSRLIWGGRISLLIGLSVMVISGLIGTALGVAAGYFGGKVDLLVGYVVTTRLSLPVILVALAVVALVGSSLPLVIAILGL